MKLSTAAALAAAVIFGLPPAASAGWKGVLVSGGGTPPSNAVAHEKNILFVQRTLGRAGLTPADMLTFMSVGRRPVPDISYVAAVPQDRWELVILDRLFGHGGIALAYRHHGVTDVTGGAVRGDIVRALRQSAGALRSGDTLLVYTTDHGQRNEADLDDNYVVLWGEDKLGVRDVRGALASQHAGRVVGVFAQCYSGAFAALAFDPKTKAAVPQDRCVFAATLATREAAGCTPEIDEADYDDYTTRFFAALHGVDRMGRSTPAADYDGDGKVSLAEAHAYAVMTEDTIDVPVKSSEVFLERSGVVATGAWEAALASAAPEDRAAWQGLQSRLALANGTPIDRIAGGIQKVHQRMRKNDERRNRLNERLADSEDELRIGLLERWPVIDTPYHPQFAAALDNGEAVRDYLSQSRAFATWRDLSAQINGVDGQTADLQLDEALWLRAERAAKHVLRAARVRTQPALAAPYERLRRCEAAVPGR